MNTTWVAITATITVMLAVALMSRTGAANAAEPSTEGESALAAAPVDQPRELGRIRWERQFMAAVRASQETDKPVLTLFQEVPGCHTCVSYGQDVLSHPLVTEAAETLFVPVAVYNNKGGDDRATLQHFREPAWNNPVVRVFDESGKDVADRVAGEYSIAGISGAMIDALKHKGKKVPLYLELLHEEAVANKSGVKHATFAMPCFWTGEAAFGRIEGVTKTQPGFLGGYEVVDVWYNDNVIAYDDLVKQARAVKMAGRVFTRSNSDHRAAASIVGRDAIRSDTDSQPDRQPKYHLRQTTLRYVPMTPLQQTRANGAVYGPGDPEDVLSPRQLELLAVIEAYPKADWPDATETADFPKAWAAAMKVVAKLDGDE